MKFALLLRRPKRIFRPCRHIQLATDPSATPQYVIDCPE